MHEKYAWVYSVTVSLLQTVNLNAVARIHRYAWKYLRDSLTESPIPEFVFLLLDSFDQTAY